MAINDFNEIPDGFSFFLEEDGSAVTIPETLDALPKEDQNNVPVVTPTGTPEAKVEDVQPDNTAPIEDEQKNDHETQHGSEPQKDNEKVRYEYWQSEATKYKRELETITPYKDIAKFLQENPNALDAVNQYLTKGTKEVEAPSHTTNEPHKPTLPQKPEGYNRADILDPDSPTARYEEARAQYQIDMINYYEQAEQYKENLRQKAYEEDRRKLQETQKKSEFDQALLTHGLKPEQLDTFYKVMNDPKSVDPKNVIKYFQILNGEEAAVSQRQQEFERQQKRSSAPAPAGTTGGGETPKTLTDEELFNKALLSAGT